MPSQFPIITDGIHGDVPINFYPTPDSERGAILEPSPRVNTFSTLASCTEVRGLYAWGDYLYAVTRRGSYSPVWRINSGGTATEIGEIDTSSNGRVYFADNPTQLAICDGVTEWVYTPATGAVVLILNENFPGAAGLTYQDGYGISFDPNTTIWRFSDINDF